MPQGNQHKPIPPIEDLAIHILEAWKMRKADVKILEELRQYHINPETHGLGMTKFREMRASLGLLRTRQQGHTVETIRPYMIELRERYPNAGARDMVMHIFKECGGIQVSKDLLVAYFRIYEPTLVRERKAGRLIRRRFWAAGVNDIIAVDQHDKWKKFGLALHTGVDPFCRVSHWVKVWWTNSDPKIVLSYYIEMVRKTGKMPLVTQSDPGSENYGLANGHTTLRHMHDANLQGTIQHRWMRHKKNVMPEIAWSQLRRRFTPGFENILQKGVDEGWYDTSRSLDVLVFRWVFIPFLQKELDSWVDSTNYTKKRKDRNKITPHGVPIDIYRHPERFGCLDFGIEVNQPAVDQVEAQFAPKDDPVFQLVPPMFDELARMLHQSMESPEITWRNVWDVYQELLYRFEHLDEATECLDEWAVQVQLMDLDPEFFEEQEQAVIPLMEGRDLLGGMDNPNPDGSYYMGGVNGGRGLDASHIAALDAMDNNGEFEIEVNFSDNEEIDDDGDEW